MKVATILPQKFMQLVEQDDYHMALAHLINAPGFEVYTDRNRLIGANKSKFLIMDTGLIEGDARPTQELIEKARYVQADEMVLNDVFEDRNGTLIETAKALDLVKASGLNIRTMAVPQGRSLMEWLDCAITMLNWDIDTIGIPKVLTRSLGAHGRLEALKALAPHLANKPKDIHLLGCWESPIELSAIEHAVSTGSIPPVRGVDTAIAYAYAREGIRITEDERPQGAIDFGATFCDIVTLGYNISVVKLEASDKQERNQSLGNVVPLM